ncbi:MAG: four-carbon acid sugar kinase family protein [Verrucomicrobiota bacterium JB022]|nr:four-carbon acid sugar kinase family protein [Verrucomicrobiota bacterium JB022]
MSRVIAVADDLTGAAEIAAIGQAHGLRSLVVRGPEPRLDPTADLVVGDTDTRLDAPDEATRRLGAMLDGLSPHPGALWYKKTDSVLRGAVAEECAAMAAWLGRERTLLVPANPGLRRQIIDGTYLVDGVPLHQTPFARDPRHPATTAQVTELLQRFGPHPVHLGQPGRAAREGLVVGETATSADVTAWAREVDAQTLAAGGAEFFAALLRQQGCRPPVVVPPPTVPSPALIVLGSIADATHAWRELAISRGAKFFPLPVGADPAPPILAGIASLLEKRQTVVIAADARGVASDSLAQRAAEVLSGAVAHLYREWAFQHLVIAGGSTAAAILDRLQWHQLEMAGSWAPGVVSLAPKSASHFIVTLKPGSYAWPETLNTQLLRA